MRILVNGQACREPSDCRACLDRCPEKVFGTCPPATGAPGFKAGDWVIFPMFLLQCTGCLECVIVCPRQAISLS